MEQKNSKIFSKEIMQTVFAFCEDENIKDIDNFMYLCFKQGFDIKRYGLLGKTLNEDEKDLKTGIVGEKQVIKEVIVEKIVEVPVEVIKEVEKVVTKIEYISDKNTENDLNETITKKDEEISKLSQTLDELRRNLDIPVDDNKLKMLQQTIQNLTSEVRELKKKNEELEKQLLDTPKQLGDISAKFHGSSNLNDDLYK